MALKLLSTISMYATIQYHTYFLFTCHIPNFAGYNFLHETRWVGRRYKMRHKIINLKILSKYVLMEKETKGECFIFCCMRIVRRTWVVVYRSVSSYSDIVAFAAVYTPNNALASYAYAIFCKHIVCFCRDQRPEAFSSFFTETNRQQTSPSFIRCDTVCSNSNATCLLYYRERITLVSAKPSSSSCSLALVWQSWCIALS